MKNVKRIIEENGGWERLARENFSVENGRGQVLEILSPREGGKVDAALVSQYEAESGGIIRAPEIFFEVTPGGLWIPVCLRDDFTGETLNVFRLHKHLTVICCETSRELFRRAAEWDRKIRELGFVDPDPDSEYYPLFANA